MADLVTMVKDGQEAKVVRSAFEGVWKDKGWRLKGERAVPKPAPKLEEEPAPKEKSSESATS